MPEFPRPQIMQGNRPNRHANNAFHLKSKCVKKTLDVESTAANHHNLNDRFMGELLFYSNRKRPNHSLSGFADRGALSEFGEKFRISRAPDFDVVDPGDVFAF